MNMVYTLYYTLHYKLRLHALPRADVIGRLLNKTPRKTPYWAVSPRAHAFW